MSLIMSSLFISNVFISGDSTLYLGKNRIGIDFSHYKIHEGKHYFIQNFTDLGSGENITLQLFNGEKQSHLVIESENELEAEFYLYENCTIINNGTQINYLNRNRAYADTNSVTLFTNPSFSNCENILKHARYGSGRTFGSENRDYEEIILKKNTNYIFFAINDVVGSNNLINYILDWYQP